MTIVESLADSLMPATLQRKIKLLYEYRQSNLSLDYEIVIIAGVVIGLDYLIVDICLGTHYWIVIVGIANSKFQRCILKSAVKFYLCVILLKCGDFGISFAPLVIVNLLNNRIKLINCGRYRVYIPCKGNTSP